MVMIAGVLLVAVFFAPVPVPALINHDRPDATHKAPWNATFTDNLKRAILFGYDKFARPSHHTQTTNVSLGLSIYHLELDDTAGMMTIHGWVKMSWNDEKLKWNSSDYGGLGFLHVGDHEIWQPDVVQYNSASGSAVDQYGNTHCIIYESGNVIWVPPAKMTAFCKMDLTNWPQDEQKCTFTFGSWTYDGISINLKSDLGTEENNDHYIENGEWELLTIKEERHEKMYDCCPDAPYVSVDYEIHVRRRGIDGTRGTLVRTPAAAAALLALLTHCLPPRSFNAARLPLTAAPPAIIAFALLYFSHRLPSASTTPNIIMLYCISLYMVCISGVISVIVINLAMARRALPWAVRRALCSRFARLLQLPKLAERSTGAELQGTNAAEIATGTEEGTRILSGMPPPARDWLALATALDRITFIILLIVFIIIAIIYGC